jgi:hypothetical protein
LRKRARSEGEGNEESEAGSGRRHAIAHPFLLAICLVLVLCGGLASATVARHHAVISTALSGASRPLAFEPSSPSTSPPPQKTNAKAPAKAKAAPPPATATTVVTTVPPAGVRHDPNAIVTLPAAVTMRQLDAVRAMPGVEAVEVVDVGTVSLQGAPANTIGVEPGSFRNFTPKVSADADRLWQYISTGTLASSFEMSRDRKLSLGVEVPVAAARSGPTSEQWLGAFMSIGLPGIDLVVSRRLTGPLGLSFGSGLVVSAPSADAFRLQTALKVALPGASVVLMRPGLALGGAPGASGGAAVTKAQLSTALTAAVSRVGKPYVWGGTGPDGFDCSGLVGWSFAAAGVHLPRTAAEQALAGAAVPLNQLQPGDLLFWAYDPADPGFIDHVAIYLGNGQMIESPQTGFTVHVIPVQGHIVGAVRINPAAAARLGSPWP